MNRLRQWLSRLLDWIDLAFDGLGALMRVLLRGAFQVDARSYRGGQFRPLPPKDVLLQVVDLNAEDDREARAIIALEPDRYLPLDLAVATYDIAGPVGDALNSKGQEEGASLRFVLGVVRRGTLEAARADTPPFVLTPIEAFTFQPADYPELILVVADEAGARQRRLRRSLLLLATIALAWSGYEAVGAWRARLDRQVLAAESENLAAERRVRIAERRLVQDRAILASLVRTAAPSLSRAVEQMEILARRQPLDAETYHLEWTDKEIDLKGRGYTIANAELEIRRGFETAVIDFTPQPSGGSPEPYQAQILWPQSSGAPQPVVAAPRTAPRMTP